MKTNAVSKNTQKAVDKRCCWISYLDIQTYLRDKSQKDFTDAVSEIYDKLIDFGIDTVIVQVRPMGDAIYPSIYFPISEYISSDRILTDYDPLLIMIDEAHKRGLDFEAWINPYRLSRSDETTQSYKKLSEYEAYADFIYSYTNPDGEECLSLEPSDQRSIDLIVAGVKEVLENYDVDGIHFDDYFYVEGMYDGSGSSDDIISTDDRMKYVNSMISQVYEAVKKCNTDCTFGVSPAGNIEAAKGQGVDVKRWLSTPGYVDYIMPQIYWTDYYETKEGMVTMFSDMAAAWQSANVLDLPIYVGLALYRVGETSTNDKGWGLYDDNLAKSFLVAKSLGYDGYALFRYEWFNYASATTELENLRRAKYTYSIRNIIDEITDAAVLMQKKYLK